MAVVAGGQGRKGRLKPGVGGTAGTAQGTRGTTQGASGTTHGTRGTTRGTGFTAQGTRGWFPHCVRAATEARRSAVGRRDTPHWALPVPPHRESGPRSCPTRPLFIIHGDAPSLGWSRARGAETPARGLALPHSPTLRTLPAGDGGSSVCDLRSFFLFLAGSSFKGQGARTVAPSLVPSGQHP